MAVSKHAYTWTMTVGSDHVHPEEQPRVSTALYEGGTAYRPPSQPATKTAYFFALLRGTMSLPLPVAWAALGWVHAAHFKLLTSTRLLALCRSTLLPVVRKLMLRALNTAGSPSTATATATAAGASSSPVSSAKLAWAAVLASALLHYPGTFQLYHSARSLETNYDNANPRTSSRHQEKESLASRLFAAHQSSGESFVALTAAVACASFLSGGDLQEKIAALAWTHVGWRVLHLFAYALNIPNVRTFVFIGGWHSVMYIFTQALLGQPASL